MAKVQDIAAVGADAVKHCNGSFRVTCPASHSPPQVRGEPLELKRFSGASGLILIKRNGYSQSQYHQWAGVPAVNRYWVKK